MAITVNTLKKNSLNINPTFEYLIQTKSNLLSVFQDDEAKEILTKVNLIGLLDIDNLQFIKDYTTELQTVKNLFNNIYEFDDIEKTFTPLFTVENFEALSSRVQNITEFLFIYGYEEGLKLIKKSIIFLEKNSSSDDWKIFYSDIWQISYSLAISKDLTLSQVDPLNSLGIVNIQPVEQITEYRNSINIFKNLTPDFFSNLREKIEDLKKAYSIENVTETITFLNSLDNSKLKTFWLFVSLMEIEVFQEELESEYSPVLKPMLEKIIRYSQILDKFSEFNNLKINLFETSSFEHNYAIFDDVKSDLYNLSLQIANDNSIQDTERFEITMFIEDLSKLLGLLLREKNYPINLIGDEEYLSAYDFINYFQDSLPIIFDVFEYDLSEFNRHIQTNDMDEFKTEITSKASQWDKRLDIIAGTNIKTIFESRYNKLKQVFDMVAEPLKKGDHQNIIKNLFVMYGSVPNRVTLKNNYSINTQNIESIVQDLETILKTLESNSNKKNIDTELFSSIAINLGLLGYNPTFESFDKKHLSNYLNGFYNFDAINNRSIIEDLRGFII